MKIYCDQCSKAYNLKPEFMTSNTASFNCLACKNEITVHKPVENISPEIKPQPSPEPSAAAKTTSPAMASPRPAKEKRRFGLVLRIVSVMLFVALVPLFGFGIFSLMTTSQRIENDVENLGREITNGLASHVEEWIDKNVRVLHAIADMPDTKSMAAELQVPLLEAVQKQYPWMYLVFTTDVDGRNIARSDGKALRNYGDRQYYKDVMAGKVLAWQTLIGKTSKRPAMVLAVPVKRGDQIVGVLANAMTTDALSKRIATWKQGRTGYAFLVDETGKVVAHPKKEFVLKQRSLKDHPLVAASRAGRKGIVEFTEDDGTLYLGQSTRTANGWTLVIQQSKQEAYAQLRSSQNVAILILITTVLLVILIAATIGRALARPIVALTNAADRISVGELDIDIKPDRNDEIGDLANAIGRMQDSIRIAIQRIRRRN